MIPPVTMTSFHPDALGGDGAYGASSLSSLTWAGNGTAFYIPFYLRAPILYTHMAKWNGATASGNFDLGVYDEAGTLLTSTGSTAQVGTSQIQITALTASFKGTAGLFYMAISGDSTVGTTKSVALGGANPYRQFDLKGVRGATASAFPLPATITLTLLSDNTFTFIPFIALLTDGNF